MFDLPSISLDLLFSGISIYRYINLLGLRWPWIEFTEVSEALSCLLRRHNYRSKFQPKLDYTVKAHGNLTNAL